MENILKISGLKKYYGNIKAVDGVNFTVNKNDIFGILGPNGSGKTTTLLTVLGLLKPDSGSFQWFDFPEGFVDNKLIGTVIENTPFYPHMSLFNNLRIIAEIREIDNPKDEIEFLLEKVRLIKYKHLKVNQISFGMRQRLAFAAAMIGKPKVLVLDEPTKGMDPRGISLIRQNITDFVQNGGTVILASHILSEVEKICTKVAIYKAGKIILKGKLNDIVRESLVYVQSPEIIKLRDILADKGLLKNYELNKDVLIIEDIDKETIAKIALENQILLTSLTEKRKKTLEQVFLELVKN